MIVWGMRQYTSCYILKIGMACSVFGCGGRDGLSRVLGSMDSWDGVIFFFVMRVSRQGDGNIIEAHDSERISFGFTRLGTRQQPQSVSHAQVGIKRCRRCNSSHCRYSLR